MYSVQFHTDRVKQYYRTSKFSNRSRLVPINYLTHQSNEDLLEDCIVHVRILSCTLGKNPATISWTANNNGKKSRVSQQTTYNRYFYVADVTNPPYCAAIITRSGSETNHLVSNTRGEQLVGMDFYIKEPNLSLKTLGEATPVLETSTRDLIPLVSNTVNLIPACHDLRPDDLQAGQGGYFVMKDTKINLRRATLCTDTKCIGKQCDRQKRNGDCSCVYGTAQKNFVYSFDVSFEVPITLHSSKKLTIPEYRSLSTTALFFKDHSVREVSMQREENGQTFIRDKIKTMTQIINQNGGWTIVGWMKRGETTDLGTGQDKVENVEVTMHLSCLRPTNPTATSQRDYKDEMIKLDEPTMTQFANTITLTDDDQEEEGTAQSTSDPASNNNTDNEIPAAEKQQSTSKPSKSNSSEKTTKNPSKHRGRNPLQNSNQK